MSVLTLSMQCSTRARLGPVVFDVEPDHENCPGGEITPGVLGGWTCSCWCHAKGNNA